MKLSLNNVLVFAPDLTVARQFYGETLGLSLTRAEQECIVFSGENFTLTIFRCGQTRQPGAYSQESGAAIVFSVAFLDEAVASLRARGVNVLHDTPNEGPVGRYVAFADPFGTVHELVEPTE